MPTLSFIVVSFYSSAPLREALRSLREEMAAARSEVETIIVDHSGDPMEHQRLLELEPTALLKRENRGYAAGLNAGVKASTGELLLLANPDLVFRPGSLTALLGALDAGWDIVGPQFELGGALFPAAEMQTPRQELRRIAARRDEHRRCHYLRAHARASHRLWQSCSPQPVTILSGALLATRRETFAQVGPWDEGYFLYFEEADWLLRAQALKCRLGMVPASRVRHAWGHAARPGEQGDTFERSRRRYYDKHFPGWAAPQRARDTAPGWLPLSGPPACDLVGTPLWLVSPSPWGFPAAGLGCLPAEDLPAALHRFSRARSHRGALFVSAYDPGEERVLGTWEFRD